MPSEQDVLMAEAVLGRDAQQFLSSDLWRYIEGRAEQEVQEAQEALSCVSPWRRNRIRQLQNQVWRAKTVQAWLRELVTAGDAAESLLSQVEIEE
jgi:hypothetical protein